VTGIDQWAARALSAFGYVTAVLFASSVVEAAPSAVVFAPTGTVYEAGEFMGFVFPSAAGAQAGLWNGVATETGRFLAVEAGIDVYGTDPPGARPAPVANAKIGLADEHGARPSVAFGVDQVSTVPQSSADLVYLTFNKGLSAGRTPLGYVIGHALRERLGLARWAPSPDDQCFRSEHAHMSSHMCDLQASSQGTVRPL
jgi:hypothetical protein